MSKKLDDFFNETINTQKIDFNKDFDKKAFINREISVLSVLLYHHNKSLKIYKIELDKYSYNITIGNVGDIVTYKKIIQNNINNLITHLDNIEQDAINTLNNAYIRNENIYYIYELKHTLEENIIQKKVAYNEKLNELKSIYENIISHKKYTECDNNINKTQKIIKKIQNEISLLTKYYHYALENNISYYKNKKYMYSVCNKHYQEYLLEKYHDDEPCCEKYDDESHDEYTCNECTGWSYGNTRCDCGDRRIRWNTHNFDSYDIECFNLNMHTPYGYKEFY